MKIKRLHKYLTYLALMIIATIIVGCGGTSKSKYYVEPRKDYTITDSDFDFLDEETREQISLLLQKNIEWYNGIEYDEAEGKISADELDDDELSELGSKVMKKADYKSDKKRFYAIFPSTKAYGELAGYMVNNDRDISLSLNMSNEDTGDAKNDFSISITPEEWMLLHDELQEALDFYYNGVDHERMNSESEIEDESTSVFHEPNESTSYSPMTNADKEKVEKELYATMDKEPIFGGGDYNISVDQEKVGEFSVIYAKRMTISVDDYLLQTDKEKEYTEKICGAIIDILYPTIKEYEKEYGAANFVVVYGDKDAVPLIMMDKDKNVVYDYGSNP